MTPSVVRYGVGATESGRLSGLDAAALRGGIRHSVRESPT